MKILILMRSSILTKCGGAEVQAEFIRQACVNAGHEVHFAFDKREETDIDINIDDDSTHYHLLPDRGRLRSYLNYFELNQLIQKIRPDMIYQRVRFSYTGVAAYLAKRYGVRFVHNISADYACRKNRVPLDKKFISSFITEQLGRYGIKHADLLIAQTTLQAKLLKKNFGLDSIVVPNGHPFPEGPFKKIHPPVVAWVANIKPWKQPEIFIELARRLGDTNARFVLAGRPAMGSYQERILRLIDATPNVEYKGQLSLDEVNSLLSQASVFVNTSEPREGFPNFHSSMDETGACGYIEL
ncbi:MAG: glycosyltransferase family 4 protein [Desulfamplus sp.]|nr:glycosyltransferase family 4 protein [Desulfamplus sp.]